MTHRRNPNAEATPSRPNGAEHGSPKELAEKDSSPKGGKRKRRVPPGKKPLPVDAGEFVEEIHGKIDLTEVWHGLLRSGDEKIKQRAAEKLTEMRYKGVSSLADEPQQLVMDIDSAVARRAAQGAKK